MCGKWLTLYTNSCTMASTNFGEDAPMSTEPKTDRFYVRVSEEIKAGFTARAELHGRSASDVVRELVTAWAAGRVTIHPPQ